MSAKGLAVIVARASRSPLTVSLAADLAGSPQVAWSVRAARAVPDVSRVLVVTDDPSVVGPAERAGAETVWCDAPASIASLDAALRFAMQGPSGQGPTPELMLCVDAAYPLLLASDLGSLVATLSAEALDRVGTAVVVARPALPTLPGHAHSVCPPHDAHADGAPGAWLLETGAAYALRPRALHAGGPGQAGRALLSPIDATRSMRIESALERELAEVVLRARLRADLAAHLPSALRAVVFDFDGVLTDNAVWVHESGQESVRCDRGDGMGLGLLKASGVRLLILSKERNPVVSARAKKLGIECLQGIDNKLDELERWLLRQGVVAADAVYVGNDVNDLECMRHVGCAVCPQDAHPTARQASRVVLTHPGGHGAVRELCDLILGRLADAVDSAK